MHVYCTSTSIAPKHEGHVHSQNSLFYTKIAKYTKFPPTITTNSSNDPPNYSIIAELFPTQEKNARQRMSNDSACASSINIKRDELKIR